MALAKAPRAEASLQRKLLVLIGKHVTPLKASQWEVSRKTTQNRRHRRMKNTLLIGRLLTLIIAISICSTEAIEIDEENESWLFTPEQHQKENSSENNTLEMLNDEHFKPAYPSNTQNPFSDPNSLFYEIQPIKPQNPLSEANADVLPAKSQAAQSNILDTDKTDESKELIVQAAPAPNTITPPPAAPSGTAAPSTPAAAPTPVPTTLTPPGATSTQQNAAPATPDTDNTPEEQNEETAKNPNQVGAEIGQVPATPKTILINFNNVNIIEYIRFISRITNRNFVFDENDLQFNVTIVSEEPATLENIMTALLQELRIHDLSLLEQGQNLIIHKNPKVGVVSKVVADNLPPIPPVNAELITQVFSLNTIPADKAALIIKHMVSDKALVDVLKETNHLIITDLSANVFEINRLLKSLDSPQSGAVIGQYVVRNSFIDALIQLGEQIMRPIAEEQPLIFVPHAAANSIFIVSNPYLVERTISILQYLDQNQGTTQILNPSELQFTGGLAAGQGAGAAAGAVTGGAAGGAAAATQGQWRLNNQGNWEFVPSTLPGVQVDKTKPPQGRWIVDPQGNWFFQPGEAAEAGAKTPDGKWILDPKGIWVFQLAPGKSISPETLTRNVRYSSQLPVGHIERTQFSIYKLRYRNGDQIAKALSLIGQSLQQSGTSNTDLVATINSIQWLESSNSMVFSGTAESVEKVKNLIAEVDTPLRQVFLEMLILSASLDDTYTFSVNPGARFGGGQVSGSEAFLSGASSLPPALATADIVGGVPLTAGPYAGNTILTEEFGLGVIGQHLSFNGQLYATLGLLVRALHTKATINVILNPKILTEDNSPAEIFVGTNTQFPTQSISNDLGSIVTQNFEFRDVGTRLKVTPLIGNDDTITLQIEEEVSSIVSGGTQQISNLSNQVIGPTTDVSRTTTRVHLPNKYFLIISGVLRNEVDRTRIQMPCLGGVPVLGAMFSDKDTEDHKRNLLIFIRPEIIDTQEQIDNLTRHQQDVFRVSNRSRDMWKVETSEGLDLMNLEDTDDSEEEHSCYYQ